MAMQDFLLRLLGAATLLVLTFFAKHSVAAETKVTFDLPDSIECRDVTPKEFAVAYPTMKVIEAKFRVSVRIDGDETSIVDFLYLITTPELRLKIQDYLPNTMVESTKVDDHIEVTSSTEDAKATGANASVGYKTIGLGLSRITGLKRSESDHYKQIVPKALVLASGTINRQHGVFFKLRPSTGVSLEGAKEFTILAIVFKEWRADWITMACAARAKTKSFFSTTVGLVGIEQAHVGLYLMGDGEGTDLAEELCAVQEANSTALATQLAKDGERLFASMQLTTTIEHPARHYDAWLHGFLKGTSESHEALSRLDRKRLEDAKASMLDVEQRLSRLSGIGSQK